MKIRNTIAVMICIMLLASCCIVAAAASGSENVGGGFWLGKRFRGSWQNRLICIACKGIQLRLK